jgi:ribonuclease BN (tRNA processing enzyme)
MIGGNLKLKKPAKGMIVTCVLGEGERCSSCESSHLEVYIKRGNAFLVCLDCGLKELID